MMSSTIFSAIIDTVNQSIEKRHRQEYGVPQAAVLVLLFEENNIPYIILTKRAATLRTHSGQISFPGGKVDDEDNNVIATALRETNEEIGVVNNQISIIGLLDDFATPYYHCVTPVIGYLYKKVKYKKSEDEIDEILEVPLHELMNDDIHHTELRRYGNMDYTIHFYDWVSPKGKSYTIWGATGGVLSKFLEILRASLKTSQYQQLIASNVGKSIHSGRRE